MKLSEFEEKDNLLSDPLFRFISMSDRLKDQLEPDFLADLEFERPYTTKETSLLLGKSDGNLRYYLRELDEYIAAPRFGRNYKLQYIHIYRLHLILVMMSEGLSVQDISVQLGLQPQVTNEPRLTPIHPTTNTEDEIERKQKEEQILSILMRQENINQHLFERINLEKALNSLNQERQEITALINSKKEEKKLKKLEIRQQKQTDQFISVLRERANTGGFLSQLFKKQSNTDIKPITDDDINTSPLIAEIDNEIEELTSNQSLINEKIKKLEENLKESDHKLKELNHNDVLGKIAPLEIEDE